MEKKNKNKVSSKAKEQKDRKKTKARKIKKNNKSKVWIITGNGMECSKRRRNGKPKKGNTQDNKSKKPQ